MGKCVCVSNVICQESLKEICADIGATMNEPVGDN